MKRLLHLLPAIAVLMTLGCEKTIPFKGESSDPVLVVNTILSPDSNIKATVTSSRFFLEKKPLKEINNAVVRLFVNGEYKGVLKEKYENGPYVTHHKLSAGDRVKIEAVAQGYPAVWGTTTLPLPPAISSVDTASRISKKYHIQNQHLPTKDTVGEYTERMVRFGVKFNDDGNSTNYYRLIVKKRTYFKGGAIHGKEYLEEMVTDFDDIVFRNDKQQDDVIDIFGDDSSSKPNRFNVFSDEIFNGKTYRLTFADPIPLKYTPKGLSISMPFVAPERTVYLIYLQEISADYYLYVQSMNSAMSLSVDDPFAEPVQVRSNIANGIGIIGSYTSSPPYIVEFNHK